jgi:MFS family permease
MTFLKDPMPILRAAALGEGIGATMLLIFVPHYVRSALNEPSLTIIALMISLPAVATLLASNFWGALADITGRYGMITSICLSGFTLCLVLLPILRETSSVIILISCLSLLYGAVRPLLLSQATLLHEKEKPRVLSSIFMFESLGFFVGGLLYGFGQQRAETPWVWTIFFASGFLCLVASVLIMRVKTKPAALNGSLFSSLKNDLKEVYHSVTLLKLSVVVLITSISNFCFFGMYFAYFTEGVGASGVLMSMTLSVSTAIGFLFFPLARRGVERWGGRLVLSAAIIGWIGNYTALSFIRNPYVASLIFLIPIYPFFLVSVNTLAAQVSRSERRGGGLGALAGINALSMTLGTVLGGGTGDLLGPRAIPCVSSVISMLALVSWIILLKPVKTEPS